MLFGLCILFFSATVITAQWITSDQPASVSHPPQQPLPIFSGHCAVAMPLPPHDVNVLVLGGTTTNDVWSLTPMTGLWTKIPKATFVTRRFHTCTRCEDDDKEFVLIFGGISTSGELSQELLSFSFSSFHSELVNVAANSKKPPARYKHAAVMTTDMSTLFIHGGLSSSQDPLADAWLFNVKSHVWSQLSSPERHPVARYAHALASFASYVILVGGISRDKRFISDIWILDLTTHQWKSPVPPSTRHPPTFSSGVVGLQRVHDTLYIVTGLAQVFASKLRVDGEHGLHGLEEIEQVNGPEGTRLIVPDFAQVVVSSLRREKEMGSVTALSLVGGKPKGDKGKESSRWIWSYVVDKTSSLGSEVPRSRPRREWPFALYNVH